MSAIAGILRLDGAPVTEEDLLRIASPVLHRGSGQAAYWAHDHVGLAQVGTPGVQSGAGGSIVTRSRDGSAVIVFDGRLDDLSGLIQLLGLPSGEQAASDAGLALLAYQKWGAAFTSHLTGDYALAVYDQRDGNLICARDPVGAQILNYSIIGDAFVFGTEIKQVLAHPGSGSELDLEMLGLFLCGAARFGDLTLYKQVRRLQGGYTLRASRAGVKTEKVWELGQKRPIKYKTEDEYLNHFRSIIVPAVTDRLRSNGPATIFLSGGLDSGTIACIAGAAAARNGKDLQAVYFEQSDPVFDESPFAEEICNTYGIELTKINSDEFWAMKRDHLEATRDEPFIVPFELMNQEGVKIAASTGSKAVLTGEGGDEAFSAGYMLYLRDWLRTGKFVSIWKDLSQGTPEYRRSGFKFLKQHTMPRSFRRRLGRYRTSTPAWLRDDFVTRTGLRDRLEDTLGESYMDRNYFSGRGSHPFFILWDHRAASFGVEASHPFWDIRLVEFMSLIPPSVRLQGGRGKLFMKKALRDVLTPGLLTREPFAAMTRLFNRGWHEEFERFELVSQNSVLAELGVIDPGVMMRNYREYLAGDLSKSGRLFWTLLADEWLIKTGIAGSAASD